MNITSIVSFLGGLAFFLFGMNMMGDALKKVAGNKMQMILGRLTSSKLKGITLGTMVTAIIQSSSATSVMVVSFVSSGIMSLTQAISVVMGANIGTTATGWLLTLAGIEGGSAVSSILSTAFIFGVVAVIGIILYMFGKNAASTSTGIVLVSLSVLMAGMTAMSSAVEPLQSSEAFVRMMGVANPALCVIVGIAVTAVIQSCSATIGILQAISMTGIIPYSVAIPMVVGMSIGACVPVLICAITASKDGKRTALSYLYFNVLGGAIFLAIYAVISFTSGGAAMLSTTTDSVKIAIVNTLFKVFSVAILYPFVGQLEKLVKKSIKDDPTTEEVLLDEMLLDYPAQALELSGEVVARMASCAKDNMNTAMRLLENFDIKKYQILLKKENRQDEYEDKLGSFLVKLNAKELRYYETQQSAKYLRCASDLERISDHAENIAELAKAVNDDKLSFSSVAKAEMAIYFEAMEEILSITMDALINDDIDKAYKVEPLEEIIDTLTKRMKQNHIVRLQRGDCSLRTGFIYNDCVNNMERAADHCSNIAISVIEMFDKNAAESHHYLRKLKQGDSEVFQNYLDEYGRKYEKRMH